MVRILCRALTGGQLAGRHGKEHLDRLGPHPAAHQARRLLGLGPGVEREIVDLGHVARRPGGKHHHDFRPEQAANGLLDVIDVVGRRAARTGRGMTSEIDDAADQLVLLVPRPEHADVGIDRAGGENIGVAGAGMRERQAVLHAEAAVEGHLVFASLGDAAPARPDRRRPGTRRQLFASRPARHIPDRPASTFRRPAPGPRGKRSRSRRGASSRSGRTSVNRRRQ